MYLASLNYKAYNRILSINGCFTTDLFLTYLMQIFQLSWQNTFSSNIYQQTYTYFKYRACFSFLGKMVSCLGDNVKLKVTNRSRSSTGQGHYHRASYCNWFFSHVRVLVSYHWVTRWYGLLKCYWQTLLLLNDR